MMLYSQSQEPVHFQSESANKNCAPAKTKVKRFGMMTLNSLSEEPIHFQSESANGNYTHIKTNVSQGIPRSSFI